ncbi:histone-lysine N-methyltransferase SETD1B-A-like isoform X1 [Metopolophium dirhodum]|uniref:histone-lysine N-methyltransferase SETD1B-A-like isoform X1 n=1 Tax=Metopolophium dirhodum TaxID=44670 RepID=UPI00298FE7EA|nr:histone-lysine N-methyltransferase SETD1B-A-like isoform X1 [Metopolophium dirhodum]XP_060864603.1 histone-lysine N-methyltransferase SETD1B-A-like isoform X1 [Metopolophium dirhodum]
MESYRKYSSRHHDSRHHNKHHKHRHRHHHYRYDEEEYESHRVHQRHHNHRSSDEDSEYEYNRNPSTRVEKPPSPMYHQPTRRPTTPPPPPPPPPPPQTVSIIEKPKERNWKLLADPFLSKAVTKIYRYDGVLDPSLPEMPNDDPRKTFKTITLPIELPVPKFKLDRNYIGQRPEVEVTFSNLNDNIDKVFLTDLVVKFGKIELLQIFYHPVTKKHLGLAKIIFEEASSARHCVQRLNDTSVMGKVVSVFLDPFASECKSMFGKMTEEKPKPLLEVPKSKPLPISNRDRRSVKICKSKEEPSVKPQTEEKPTLPPKTDNYKNYSYDYTTPSPATSDLPSEQSYSSGYNSMGGTPAYNGTYPPYSFNRYPCSVPPVPNNHWWGESSPILPPLPSAPAPITVPAPAPASKLDSEAQSKLDLDTRIEMLLSGMSSQGASVEPAFLSIVKKDTDDVSDIVEDTIDDDVSLNLPPPPGDNDNQSDLDEEKISNDEETLPPLSNPPSPFLSKDVYIKCFETAAEQLKITREKEKLEAKSFLNNTIRNVINKNMHDSLHSDISSSDDEFMLGSSPKGNTPDDAMSLSSLSSRDEKIVENDPNIPPQYPPLPNYPPQGYYYPPQFNNHYGYQYFPYPPNYPYGPPLPRAGFYEPELPRDRPENKNFPAELRKNLMNAVLYELRVIIKRDLMKKMGTAVAFNALDQWWEEAERQSKSTSVNNEEPKSAHPAPNLNSILEAGTEGLETLALSGLGLGFRAAIPKMPSFRRKKKEPSPKKTNEQDDYGSDQEEMVITSDNEAKDIDDDEVTRPTFAERKRLGRDLFDSDSNSSTSELSVHSSSEEESSNDSSSNEGSLDGFVWQNKLKKLCKTMTMDDFDRVRELTPTGNETPVEIDTLPSSDEEGSFVKYKRDDKAVKRKIEDEHLDKEVEPKKRLLNGEKTPTEETPSGVFSDHSYCMPQQVYSPPPISDWETDVDINDKSKNVIIQPEINEQKIPEVFPKKIKQPLTVRDNNKIENTDQLIVQKHRDNQVKPKYFNKRDMVQEATVLFEFLTKGIDVEDINYLKQSYDLLLSNDTVHYWMNETHWVSHPVTAVSNQIPRKKKKDEWKVHDTGCGRTEGYYKVDSKQKANHKYHFGHTIAQLNRITELKRVKESTGKMLALSREARSNQRRLLTAFGATSDSDLLKFNVLKFRKKQLKFGKSAIHDWGLFAMESIAADEMVIEYVGQMVRPVVADLRERQYEATGIGSSYLFRIDLDTIIDATKCGNLARFINHSCNPNCYAKIIQIDGQKKIVIYSKQPIGVNEEITYDYKFPLEDNKIPCLCGTHCCRGTLN